jgi:hypothetical protein
MYYNNCCESLEMQLYLLYCNATVFQLCSAFTDTQFIYELRWLYPLSSYLMIVYNILHYFQI